MVIDNILPVFGVLDVVAVYEALKSLDPLAEAPGFIGGHAARRLFVQGHSTDHRLTSFWTYYTQATIARPEGRSIPNKGELLRIYPSTHSVE